MKSNNRNFKKLRLSLTDTCNFACTYCVPEHLNIHKGSDTNPHLNSEQYIAIIKQLHTECQLQKIQLTGGEPLLYFDIENLIKGILEVGIKNIGITSNGYFLEKLAPKLKAAGLTQINVSLDAMNASTFKKMTRTTHFERTINGIKAAINERFDVKLNCVVLKNINESEILPLIEFGAEHAIPVRFLELMKMGYLHHNFKQYFVSQKEILNIVDKTYTVEQAHRYEHATATYWNIKETNYKFGIIANESAPFCSDCNRLRLDSYGNIFGCISANQGINILDAIQNKEDLKPLLALAKTQKQTHHFTGSELSMLYLGG